MSKIDKEKTIELILDKCNRSIGYSIDVDKFNAYPKTDKFIKEAAKFCEVPVVYKN